MRIVRLGTDLSLTSPERTVHLVRPLRPDPPKTTDPEHPVWPGWPGIAAWFELAPLEECDVAVLALPWEDALADERLRERAMAFCADAARLGRSVFVFYHADRPVRLPIANGVMFSHSLHASKRAPSDIALPGFVEEPLPSDNISVRAYSDRPVVGFCGKAWPLGFDHGSRLRKLSASTRYLAGSLLARSGLNDRLGTPVTFYQRTEALQRLERDPRVQTRFLLRDAQSVTTPDVYRHQYLENILETDYTLTVRGVGNFSYRLYEALSCGRIPLFVNTDCVLPLSSEINWRSVCIWLEGSEVRTIADRLLTAHRAMTADEFQDRQRDCRRLWVTKLTEPGFFSSLYERLVRGLSGGDFTGAEGRQRLLRCLA